MIKQAMILAAGKGTRMRPLTLTTPKPLVSVADKPLIVWHIQRLHQAGITDITINVGYLGKTIIQALETMELGVNLRFSDESDLSEPLETAGGIRYALSQGKLDDAPFMLVNGDVWTQFDFAPLLSVGLEQNLAHLILTKNPDHNLGGDFSLQDGRVGLKQDGVENFTFAGISVMSPKIVDDVMVGQIAPLAPRLKHAMSAGQITGELMTQTWVDVGTLERLAMVDAYARTLTEC